MIVSKSAVIVEVKKPSKEIVDIRDSLLTARDTPLSVWQTLMQNPAFGWEAICMVWQSEGRRFSVSRGGICRGADGCVMQPAGPVSLAHPVEMDAAEIMHWRRWLWEEHLTQPVLQMMEPVVLQNGRIPGEYRTVASAGTEYEMCARYEGYRLYLTAMPELEAMGCRFVVRRRWDDDAHTWAEIELVHIITPAGILYGCKPNQKMKELGASKNRGLRLGLFYPFPGTRLRVLNHVTAMLETHLLQECLTRDDLEMLLPHLSCMTEEELLAFRQRSKPGSRCRAMLERILARKEASPC